MLERNRLCACKQSPSGVWAVELGENNSQWKIPIWLTACWQLFLHDRILALKQWKKYLFRVLWMLLCDSVFFSLALKLRSFDPTNRECESCIIDTWKNKPSYLLVHWSVYPHTPILIGYHLTRVLLLKHVALLLAGCCVDHLFCFGALTETRQDSPTSLS